MKRVGIYAGSFDPIHKGHVAFALAAIEKCGLEKVFFLVEPRPRYKQGLKALVHRSAMVHIATKNQPKLGNISVDQHRFTVTETLPALAARFKGAKLFFLLGDDKLKRLSNWPSIGELARDSDFIIGSRKAKFKTDTELIDGLRSSSKVPFRCHLVEVPYRNVSSSSIRKAIKTNRQPIGISSEVSVYIEEHKLYASPLAE